MSTTTPLAPRLAEDPAYQEAQRLANEISAAQARAQEWKQVLDAARLAGQTNPVQADPTLQAASFADIARDLLTGTTQAQSVRDQLNQVDEDIKRLRHASNAAQQALREAERSYERRAAFLELPAMLSRQKRMLRLYEQLIELDREDMRAIVSFNQTRGCENLPPLLRITPDHERLQGHAKQLADAISETERFIAAETARPNSAWR